MSRLLISEIDTILPLSYSLWSQVITKYQHLISLSYSVLRISPFPTRPVPVLLAKKDSETVKSKENSDMKKTRRYDQSSESQKVVTNFSRFCKKKMGQFYKNSVVISLVINQSQQGVFYLQK